MLTKREPISLERAFTLLMTNAFGGKEVLGLRAVHLKAHPFGLDVPPRTSCDDLQRRIVYIGYPGCTQVSVDGMLRLIGQYIGEWGNWGHRVWYLRTISCGDDQGHDIHYEISIGSNIYICGGCTDCSGTGGAGKDTLDGVWNCLSQMYNLPVQAVEIPFDSRTGESLRFILDFIKRETEPDEPETPAVGQYTFVAGQKVHFSDYARENKFPSYCTEKDFTPERQYVVEGIEYILDQCTCGLGKGTPFVLHPERCLVRVRHEQMHHQFLHVRVKGVLRRLSGILFDPA